MPRKRRKLNKNLEKIIFSSKKEIELILAKIYDINDEDIQKEYKTAFEEVISIFYLVKNDYDLFGFNQNSETYIKNYQNAISKFESEYEI